MSKNVTVNGTNYEGVSIVELPLTDGSGNVQFKDVDEITSVSGAQVLTGEVTYSGEDVALNLNSNVPEALYIPIDFGGELPDYVLIELLNHEELDNSKHLFCGYLWVNGKNITPTPVNKNLMAVTSYTATDSTINTITISYKPAVNSDSSELAEGTITTGYVPIAYKCSSSMYIGSGAKFKYTIVKL